MRSILFRSHAGIPILPAWRRLLLSCLTPVLAISVFTQPVGAQTRPSGAVAAELRSEAGGKLKTFYKARSWWPLWIRGNTLGPEADRMVELVETAGLDGLDPRAFDPEDLREVVDAARGGSPRALARAEIRLSRTFAAYVRALRRISSAKMVYLDQELAPDQPTDIEVLRVAGVAPSFPDYIDNMGWMSPVYAQLRARLADYIDNWATLPEMTLPPGPVLRAGTKGERVALLRERLGLAGGAAFDKELAARTKAFQAAHGLPSDAIVGQKTIAALNRGAGYYEHLLRLNLDRARILPNTGKRYIIVDAAAARLWLYEDGQVRDTMKVIVGKPTEPTPMLAGMMRYAVVNPYWNVPPDLVRKRIVPRVVEKGEKLDAMGYEALSGWTTDARVLDQSEIDWSAVAAGTQELRVRQLPGKTNSMGRMKFMFPNDLGIYLHDTPEKALFKEDARRFSSGCVRVEDAERLAQWLFGRPLEVPTDKPEQQVYLPQAVPVYITYLTAAPTENGIAFREDVYGRDADQAERFAGR
ncbi:murein L,D-transpeptidase [Sphingomonas sp. LaA6.9]|uniref:L,D-transpeptidase family protein n=1 Tax=Sphingomonas sp. LaA6.9 TaxID=2919914 RepID=UPI001F4FB9AD|nr:L,D-transpeptidase family protein [Sphingomonas sp. LaA6.9]MCJ8159835.1 L,D-transpeptidase family protein [Sphingomonas sp. LaA6.9]